MNIHFLSSFPGLLYKGGTGYIENLFFHINLNQESSFFLVV